MTEDAATDVAQSAKQKLQSLMDYLITIISTDNTKSSGTSF
jgi:hypothetical protein